MLFRSRSQLAVLQEKNSRFNDASTQIGEAILAAKNDADNIIARAQQDGEAVRQQALQQTKDVYETLADLRLDADVIRANMEKLVGEMAERLKLVYQSIDTAKEKLRVKP